MNCEHKPTGQFGCNECRTEALRAENRKLRAFAMRFLNPEDLGYTVNEALRDEAREALGIPRVIKPS